MTETRRWISPDAAVAMLRGFVDHADNDQTREWWSRIIEGIAKKRTMNFSTSDGTRYDIQYRGK